MLDLSNKMTCAILPYLITSYTYAFSKSKIIKDRPITYDPQNASFAYDIIFSRAKIYSSLSHNRLTGIKSLAGNFFVAARWKFADLPIPNKNPSQTVDCLEDAYLSFKMIAIFSLCIYYLHDIEAVNLSLSKFAFLHHIELLTEGAVLQKADRVERILCPDEATRFYTNDVDHQNILNEAQNELKYPKLGNASKLIDFYKKEFSKGKKHQKKQAFLLSN